MVRCSVEVLNRYTSLSHISKNSLRCNHKSANPKCLPSSSPPRSHSQQTLLPPNRLPPHRRTGKPSVDPTGLTRVVRRICLTFPALAPRKPRSEPLHLEAFVLAPARLDAASPSHVKSGAVAREAPERTKRERGVVPCRAAAPTGKILHYPPLAGYGALKPRRYSVYTYPVDSRLSASVPDSAILPAKPGDWFGKSVRGWSCLNTVIPDWEIVDRTKSWLWRRCSKRAKMLDV